MGRRRKQERPERNKTKFGDPILEEYLDQDDRKDTFWYDFLHLDLSEIIIWLLVSGWLLWIIHRSW